MFHVDGRPVVEKELIETSEDFLSDNFQNGVIDAAVWSQAVGGGGSITPIADVIRGGEMVALSTGAIAGDYARLYGRDTWARRSSNVGPGFYTGYNNRAALSYMVMEFEAIIANAPEIDSTTFFMGFCTNGLLDTRAQNNISGFIYNAAHQHFSTLTDNAGAETVNDFPDAVINAALWHHFRIWCFPSQIIFMIDHVYSITHTTNLNNSFVYPLFYVENATANDVILGVTNISLGYRRYGEQNLR